MICSGDERSVACETAHRGRSGWLRCAAAITCSIVPLIFLACNRAIAVRQVAAGTKKASASTVGNLGPEWLSEQPGSARAFTDSVGVQTHISYVDTPYARWPQVMAALKQLGVRHIRDGLPTTPTFLPQHQALAAAGLRCTCGFVVDPTLTVSTIVEDAGKARDVEALEAPNECDAGTNCGGGGARGVAHVVAMLPLLHEAARSLGVPLIGPSFTTESGYTTSGSLKSLIDLNNLHVYFGQHAPGTEGWGAGDAQQHRYGSFAWWADQAGTNAPGTPVVITETGYRALSPPPNPDFLPEDVEAAYVPRTLLLAYAQGIRRTFLYELLDEFPDTGYGLLRHDLSPKPAFTAVKQLLALLSDRGGNPKLAPLRFRLSSTGGSGPLRHLLLEKSDGSYVLLVWLEVSGYDPETHKSISVTPQAAELTLAGARVTRQLHFTGQGTTEAQKVQAEGASVMLGIDQNLTYLEIQPTTQESATLRHRR